MKARIMVVLCGFVKTGGEMLRVGACLFLELCFERVGGQGADCPAFQVGGELALDGLGGGEGVGGQEEA